MQKYIRVIAKRPYNDNIIGDFEVIENVDDECTWKTFINMNKIAEIVIFSSFDELKSRGIIHIIVKCLWSIHNLHFCDKSSEECGCEIEEIGCSQPNSRQANMCICSIADEFFPIYIVRVGSYEYLVYPSDEERQKFDKPTIQSTLIDLINEIRYNPFIGSRVQEAKEDFIKNTTK